MADHMDPVVIHLAHRDTAFAAVSKASIEKLTAFKKRMKWSFTWVSSLHSEFNRDFRVSFTEEELKTNNVIYNYRSDRTFPSKEAPGMSVFVKDEMGEMFHTYSAYERGLEDVMTTYDMLDMVPKGRDEDNLSHGMEWVRLKDDYRD